MMVPLIIITLLFNAYLRQQHYRVANYLPSHDCMIADVRNAGMDLTFLDGSYVQPELQDKEVFPENLSIEKQYELDLRPETGSKRNVTFTSSDPLTLETNNTPEIDTVNSMSDPLISDTVV